MTRQEELACAATAGVCPATAGAFPATAGAFPATAGVCPAAAGGFPPASTDAMAPVEKKNGPNPAEDKNGYGAMR